MSYSSEYNGAPSSPQAWGCFYLGGGRTPIVIVFPTGVGVFPGNTVWSTPYIRSSPQAWGCFQWTDLFKSIGDVFPTGVGVFLAYSPRPLLFTSLPHRRGGVSRIASIDQHFDESSPQAWGCFPNKVLKTWCHLVFPTGVGVFLYQVVICPSVAGLPHRRGGVSI